MLKSIKKSYKYLVVATAVILMVPAGLFLIVSNPKVQTYFVGKIVNRISKNISSAITVGQVEFTLFNKLKISDLLILDQNKDTLVYSSEVVIGKRKIDLKNNIFILGKIELNDPVIKIITDTSGVMNLTRYIDMLKKPADTTKTKRSLFSASQLEIKNGRFTLRDDRGKKTKTKVDFSNIRLSRINTLVEDIIVENNSVSLDIYSLICDEQSGFKVKSFSSKVNINSNEIYLSSLNMSLDSTVINAPHIGIIPLTPGSYSNFTHNVNLDFSLDRSYINATDLSYFIPGLDSIYKSFFISGNLTGTISELRGRNIAIDYNEHTSLACDFDFSGLPDIQNTYIYIDVSKFVTNPSDIEKIYSRGKEHKILPETLQNLGDITFKGNFTGFLTDFVTYGEIRTGKGNISTDISFRPDKGNSFTYKGLIKGSNINLGEITGNPDLLGNVSIEANINGSSTSLSHFEASLTGKIDSAEINNYKYRNVALSGYFTEKLWDGSIKINDNNIKLDLLGRFDFSGKLPVFDFTLNLPKAYLQNLNIAPADSSAFLSTLLTANFTGTNIDNLYGDIKIVNSRYRKLSNNLDIKNFTIRAYSENNIPAIDLRTDFFDADIRGYYNFSGIAESVKTTLAALMPLEFIKPKVILYQKKNNFTFTINFKNTDELNNIFRTGIILAEKSSMNGIFSPDSMIYITAKTSSLSLKSMLFNNLSINASISDSILSSNLNSSSLLLAGKSELKGFRVNLTTRPDNFQLTSAWDNKDIILNKGNLEANGSFTKNIFGKSLLKIGVQPTEIAIRNNLWKINPSVIYIDTTSIEIENLYIKNNENYFLIDGALSENLSDTLKIDFNGIDLASFSTTDPSKNMKNPDKIKLLLKGELNGSLSLTNIYKNFMFGSDITINDFSLMGIKYGNLIIKTIWENDLKIARINAGNNLDGVKMFDINGFYNPSDKKIAITANIKKLPVDFLNPLLKSFASEINGFASGIVKLGGKINQPILTGAIMAENASLKINYLQTKYSFNDTVRFDEEGIKFKNITAFDEYKNPIKVNGYVNHRYFNNYSVDLTLTPNNSLALNTKLKDNNLFYGTAYGSGVVTIKAADGNLAFDISASTGKNTKLYFPLTSGQSVSNYSFISFIDSSGIKRAGNEPKSNITNSPGKEIIELNMDLDITPDAEVQLIFDAKIGDRMKGYGQSSGPLNISISKNGDFRIYGEYVIEEGDYLFTLGNVLNKNFTVQNGGTITFNGDITNADIDIKAIYTLKASLYEILQDVNYSNRTVEVECDLNLTGKLFNPTIGMEITLPKADEETRSYLKNAIATDEELTRQFVYLLVMKSFYSDQANTTSSGTSTTTTGTTAMVVTTTEMLSNQISNWLSQMNKDVDFGFAYRPGNILSAQEVEFALSTQLLNDRVTINGNLDMRGNQTTTATNTNNIAGAFDVEVKLTDKIKFKVFNRSNDNFLYDNNIPYTQGFGLFFRQEFDRFRDLLKKPEKGDMKKEDNKTEEIIK
jgi:hypothetical protein